MAEIKLIATDLDGTFLKGGHTPHPRQPIDELFAFAVPKIPLVGHAFLLKLGKVHLFLLEEFAEILVYAVQAVIRAAGNIHFRGKNRRNIKQSGSSWRFA